MRRVAIAIILLSVTLSCDSPSQPALTQTSQAKAFIVSNPQTSVSSARSGSNALHASSPVAFVSLPPGSIPDAATATIRNQGSATVVDMIDGGFDPIAVSAAAGDTLMVAVSIAGTTRTFKLVVPANRPPKIVRTSPPPFKRDVVLNSRLVVVFSEPVEIASLSGQDIRLQRGATVVDGSLSHGDAQHITVEFIPAAALDQNTDYELVVSQSVRDRDGSALEAGQRVTFTTVAVATPPPAFPLPVSFELIEYQYVERPGEWYYSPDIFARTGAIRTTATILRVTLKVPGFSARPVCFSGAYVGTYRMQGIFPGIYGDFETAFTFNGARSTGGEAEAFIEYTDYAGRPDTVTIKGPVTSYTTPVEYSPLNLNTRCQ